MLIFTTLQACLRRRCAVFFTKLQLVNYDVFSSVFSILFLVDKRRYESLKTPRKADALMREMP